MNKQGNHKKNNEHLGIPGPYFLTTWTLAMFNFQPVLTFFHIESEFAVINTGFWRPEAYM